MTFLNISFCWSVAAGDLDSATMSSLKILGDHAAKLRAMVKQHGGYYGAFKVFKRTDELKEGKLIGEDQFGNKYYENNYYFKVRERPSMS